MRASARTLTIHTSQWPSSIWIILRLFLHGSVWIFSSVHLLHSRFLLCEMGTLFPPTTFQRCVLLSLVLFCALWLLPLLLHHHQRTRPRFSSPIELTIYMQLWCCHFTIGFNLMLLPFAKFPLFRRFILALTPIMFIIIKSQKNESATRKNPFCHFAVVSVVISVHLRPSASNSHGRLWCMYIMCKTICVTRQ